MKNNFGLKFDKVGPRDSEGYAMYAIYQNDLPLMHRGDHVKIKALDEKDCLNIMLTFLMR